MNKVKSILKKSPFPAVMTVAFFVIFILIYSHEFLSAITPHYIRELTFAVPFICFGIITFSVEKEKLNLAASYIITGILIPTFICLLAVAGTCFSIADLEDISMNNIDKYERVLKVTGDSLTENFPRKIPENAKKILLSYNPYLAQAKDGFALKFKIDSDYIDSYIDKFSGKAKWIGKPNDSEAEKNCVSSREFDMVDYPDLPEDFMVYVFYSKPRSRGKNNDVSLVAISKERNEIIFFAYNR